MSNVFDDMRSGVQQAEMTFRAADNVAGDLAWLLRGWLKHVPHYVLVELKRELQGFDAHRKEWK